MRVCFIQSCYIPRKGFWHSRNRIKTANDWLMQSNQRRRRVSPVTDDLVVIE